MPSVETYLEQFKSSADNWFKAQEWLEPRFQFFNEFFKKEHLIKAEWSDIQEMGNNLHCFNSLALAKSRALGKPNHPIDHYRNAFEYLARSSDPINVRLENIQDKNSTYYLKFFGKSALSELACYANPDKYVIYNRRDRESLNFLGIELHVARGDSFGDVFKKYNDRLKPIISSYESIVGKRTNTTLCLEIDQFFSWLYTTVIEPTEENPDFFPILQKFLNQSLTTNLKRSEYPAEYQGLEVKVSFGKGNVARIPWIGFFKEPNTPTNGIYPCFLYYKEENILILSKARSETEVSKHTWENEDNLHTIEQWFKENYGNIPARYGESYIMSVYDLNADLDGEIIQADLDDIIYEYKSMNFDNSSSETKTKITNQNPKRNVWLIAPGESASHWEEFYNLGLVGIGWDRLGNLDRFGDREEIRRNLIDAYPNSKSSQMHNSLCLWEFAKEINEGDIIIAKKGIKEYVGYGIVTSKYYRDESRNEYKNLRKIDWKKKGAWPEETGQIVTKTLTNISKYPEYVDRLKRLIGIEQIATVNTDSIEYYWLNANPKYWRIEDFQVGDEQSYTTHNESGNKRNRFEYFQKIKPGDLVIGYETSPTKKAVAVFEITKGAHIDEDDGNEKITFKILKFLPEPVPYEIIREMDALTDSEVMRSNQGSLFKLTKEEYHAILNYDVDLRTDLPSYTIKDAEKEIFMHADAIQSIVETLEYKKNIILQGPPGVGKTFLAKRIAYLALEEKDESKIEMIQFHQSYSYEDFIQGYRPKEDGSFKLENGIFYRFCKRAQADPENKYFFIIDEINRGNLSKIFGELMLLIEADKRGKQHAVTLTYTAANENRFYIPENLYFIGTMNTADRSLAVVDYALRRRFAFIDIEPSFDENFKNELINYGVEEELLYNLIDRITKLNYEIEKDDNLGRGFRIGHSYFCNIPKNTGDKKWYLSIVQHEIAPLVKEYWFDKEDKSTTEIDRLQNI